MPADPTFWCSLRKDFESLQPLGQFSLIWTSQPPVSFTGELLPSQWTWFRVPDESLRARLSAIALKGARALGYDSEDGWFEELRKSDFVKFDVTGSGRWNKPDGMVYEWESVKLDDVVKHSVTLCYVLEARADEVERPERAGQDQTAAAATKASSVLAKSASTANQLSGEESTPETSIVARLSAEALVRLEAEAAAFLADYLPKLEREANRSGPVRDAELLRELVVHQFKLVAQECMAVCASVEEFETRLQWDIPRFVHYGLSQYQWLADPMRRELDQGVTFFVMRANPWAKIPEKDRASVWHVGAITGEALTHTALKLRAEAWARAAAGSFSKSGHAQAAAGNGSGAASPQLATEVNDGNVGSSLKSERAEAAAGNGNGTAATPQVTTAADDSRPASAPNWESIEITFLSDERVQIFFNSRRTETHNYAELGFADGRSGKPNQAWVTLRELAEAGGTIRDSGTTSGGWSKVEKRMQEIRKVLRKHFGIEVDPLPFIEGTGYQACFKIGCSPSFRT